jgi:hypothetical protein
MANANNGKHSATAAAMAAPPIYTKMNYYRFN